ncbi:methylated-DNA-[protein]-cysteine S-methyltransferase [Halopenitus malekzadehii]|uniref:methylated-DNA--[protein]-cysteine S-methyltransferase n=1 Tax=Halopenitus malekzadehii TaxID=1267564 RepID=A0A1H6JUP6_9EURY|nr:methylated-DNA--[protein]-cysteine S-methyltransferase [Halopenitus malekzadehii]SEH66352.1 methylated-DNA-[protein]-cysteine S-methyltransferase [Halopenitus malekzadehii]
MKVSVRSHTLEIDATHVAEPATEIRNQIRAYERGDRRTFDLSVTTPDGLTGDVMAAMAEIPFGETRTYGEIASTVGSAPVAVGGACGRNPVPIVVPCHRVVRSDGSLGGYSAAGGVATKRRLLEFESRQAGDGTVQTRLPTE